MTTTSYQCIRLLIYDLVLYVGLRHTLKRPSKLKTPTAPSDLCNTTSPSQTWMHGKVSTGLLLASVTIPRVSNRHKHLVQALKPRREHQTRCLTLGVAMDSHVCLKRSIYAQRVYTSLPPTLTIDANSFGVLEGPTPLQLYAH